MTGMWKVACEGIGTIGWMASQPVPAQIPAYREALAERILERCGVVFEQPGGRLPTERQLATDLGVTRTMVRHALAALEAEGRISREVGRGTFIRSPGPHVGGHGTAESLADIGPAHVMAARRAVEPQVLPLVVAWATRRDLEEMDRCVEAGGAAESYDEFEVWDLALHHAIVTASRNPLLGAMYSDIEQARKGALWGSLKRRGDSRERRTAYQADHVALVEALRARDLPRATEIMGIHLGRVEANLLGAELPGEAA
jgi:GntR family transcriptional regulator, uxu operon transcriptional repressor